MASELTWSGAITAQPDAGAQSFDALIAITINERYMLETKHQWQTTLVADGDQDVDIGGVTGVNVLVVWADNDVVLKITTDDDTDQIVQGKILVLVNDQHPVLSLTAARAPAFDTRLRVFAGRLA